MKSLLIALALLLHDGHDDGPSDMVFKVTKAGEVKIATDVKIGGVMVKRGKYMLTHRTEAASHVFILTAADKKTAAAEFPTTELPSRFIPSAQAVKNSTLLAKEQRDHRYEVVRIQIEGENGDHVF
jgi:hypothetical protein